MRYNGRRNRLSGGARAGKGQNMKRKSVIGATPLRRNPCPRPAPARALLSPALLTLALLLSIAAATAGCGLAGGLLGGDDLPPIAYVVSDRDGNTEIWMAMSGNADARQVSAAAGSAAFPRWAPEYRMLAWINAGPPAARLMLHDPETGETTLLASDIDPEQPPVWAPDGTRIAYMSAAGGDHDYDIYMAAVADARQTRLTFTPERERIGDWSPDGQWLVFTEDDADGLLLRNPDGVNRIRLTDSADHSPVWSPKGDRIAFLRQTQNGRDIYVLRPTGSDDWADDTDESALAKTERDEFGLAWSPDGRKLAFVARLDGQTDGQTEIFTTLADGSERKQLTQNTKDDLMPVWSQQGDRIAFVSYAYGNSEILYMDGDGAGQMRLTNDNRNSSQPDW